MFSPKKSFCVLAVWISFVSLAHGEEFVSSPGDFKISLPETPTEAIAVAPGNTLVRQVIWQKDKSALLVNVQSFKSARFASTGAKEYFKAMEDQMRAMAAKPKATAKPLSHRSLDGRELQIGSSQDAEQLRIRLFYNDRTGYKLTAIGGEGFINSPQVSAFFDSFELMKSDPIESSDFVPLIDTSANFKALMLANARGFFGKPNSAAKESLNVVSANGPTQYYGIMHQKAPGISQSDASELNKLTRIAINHFTDGDGAGYHQTSVRELTQAGVKCTELKYRMDADRSRVHARRFVNNGRVYWLFVGWTEGREAPSIAMKFLNGFEFTN